LLQSSANSRLSALTQNAFYNKVCDKEFGDPAITQEDFDEGQAELMASPEYNPDLSSGSLEGV